MGVLPDKRARASTRRPKAHVDARAVVDSDYFFGAGGAGGLALDAGGFGTLAEAAALPDAAGAEPLASGVGTGAGTGSLVAADDVVAAGVGTGAADADAAGSVGPFLLHAAANATAQPIPINPRTVA